MTISTPDFHYHPFELAFSGYSNLGKTTLITRLIGELSKHYSIGYIKHDAHQYDIDHEGKGTSLARSNGANGIYINDRTHFFFEGKGKISKPLRHMLFNDFDFVFIEGHKFTDIPKLFFKNESTNLDGFKNILATTGTEPTELFQSIPHIHRDELVQIKTFAMNYFINRKAPLFGLLLTGGKSTRMKQDKALLNYHSKSQLEYGMELLEKNCVATFVSCRKEQNDMFNSYPIINDIYLESGPIGGILSAMKQHPHAAWLVLACDLPYVNEDVLVTLIKNRNFFKHATTYVNEFGLPEPLCTIYEPKSKLKLMNSLFGENPCPRHILKHSAIATLPIPFDNALCNANYFDEFKSIRKEISQC